MWVWVGVLCGCRGGVTAAESVGVGVGWGGVERWALLQPSTTGAVSETDTTGTEGDTAGSEPDITGSEADSMGALASTRGARVCIAKERRDESERVGNAVGSAVGNTRLDRRPRKGSSWGVLGRRATAPSERGGGLGGVEGLAGLGGGLATICDTLMRVERRLRLPPPSEEAR